MSYDYSKEVRHVVRGMFKLGFKMVEIDNGGDESETFTQLAKASLEIDATDESQVWFYRPVTESTPAQGVVIVSMEGKQYERVWMLLILGNSPGELISDYSANIAPDVDAFIHAFWKKFES